MDSEALQAMANDGYVFFFKDHLVLVQHNTERKLTEADFDRIDAIFPDAVLAPMDTGTQVVVFT